MIIRRWGLGKSRKGRTLLRAFMSRYVLVGSLFYLRSLQSESILLFHFHKNSVAGIANDVGLLSFLHPYYILLLFME